MQKWNAERYATNARFVTDLGSPLLDILAPKKGERFLDLGCGDGHLTAKIAERGAHVVGVDDSPEFVAAAQSAGLIAELGDGQSLKFENEFDAVFSNAALHWMLNPDAVLSSIARALRPGGRFVAEFGGHGNVAAITTALRAVLGRRNPVSEIQSPWYFPTSAEYTEKLEANGFAVRDIALIPRPTVLPTGMEGWLDTFAGPYFSGFDYAVRREMIRETISLLEPALCDDAGNWTADYVRLRFIAIYQ